MCALYPAPRTPEPYALNPLLRTLHPGRALMLCADDMCGKLPGQHALTNQPTN